MSNPQGQDSELLKEISEDVDYGSGRYVGERRGPERQPPANSRDGITLNLVGVSIAQAAKAVLGDVLKANYSVDDKVQGTVTIQTTRPTSPEALTEMLEAGLKANGATLVRSAGVYRILPVAAAERAARPVSVGSAKAEAGQSVKVVQLQYVAAIEIARILETVAPPKGVARVDGARNAVVISGSPDELSMMLDLISIFDVDWMKGLSFGVFPVKSAAPDEIARELEAIFGSGKEGPSQGTLKFLPNKRQSAVLVIATHHSYLDRARDWIHKLDKAAERSEEQMFVYKIQNRPAEQLAALLSQVLAERQTNTPGAVAPRFESGSITTQSDAPVTTALVPAFPNQSASIATGSLRRPEVTSIPSTDPISSFTQPVGNNGRQSRGTRIVADEGNNAILVYATPKEWERIAKILERLDAVATQVMIEAVIAEITLNDELKFGLRWFLEKGPSKFTFTDAVSGAVSSVFPGFFYFFSTQHINAALNAVQGITDVRVVSAPSLMVADNRTAKLQVGDQVPIVTQTSQSTNGSAAPVLNAITLKDTGVILSVTPRVSDSGRVTLEVEQEVSSVAKTTSSGIDSPTIQQRKIKTTVNVLDGQVLALGGLIQQRETVSKTQIPLLGDIPIVGNVFRHKEDRIDKTELLIFIRPRVVRNGSEARRVTDEYRAQLDLTAPRGPSSEPKLHRDLRRLKR